MTIFTKRLNKIAVDTDNYLKNFFSKQKNNSKLLNSMKYGIFSGGKRFRSAIVVSLGKIYNINYNKLIVISSAIECIHAYSLIHDDLPSMDNDDYRRGKLSVHKKYNEFTAILAGNSLLTLAFEMLSGKELNLPLSCKNDLINTLSVSSGHSGLAGGQYVDLTFENKIISKKNIIDMQKKKTGRLFGFCCESVAIIKGLKKAKRKKLKDIGIDIGLLFQIVDDLIDYQEDKSVVRKLNKIKKKNNKSTLINLFGYNKTKIFAENFKNEINKKIKRLNLNSKDLLNAVNFIVDRKF